VIGVAKNPVIVPFPQRELSVELSDTNDWELPLPAAPHNHSDGVVQIV